MLVQTENIYYYLPQVKCVKQGQCYKTISIEIERISSEAIFKSTLTVITIFKFTKGCKLNNCDDILKRVYSQN